MCELRHAKELERIAANMEGMYDSLSEVLADGNANGASDALSCPVCK